MNLLVIEDDPVLNDHLTNLLISKSHTVDSYFEGESGLSAALSGKYDLIILDVMMPNRDGFSLLNILRKTDSTPVIMLTAKGAEEERIQGFSRGADDYLTKPFNSVELLLRIEALLRRVKGDDHVVGVTNLTEGELNLDKVSSSAYVNENKVELTPTQFRLLWTLVLHKDEVLSKPFLYQMVLRRNHGAFDRSLDMHLSRIRRKVIAAGGEGERIQTVHGQGYCFS